MSIEILDISVSHSRLNGERRYCKGFCWNKKAEPIENKQYNPLPQLLNHRKHEAKIYREANGGVEKTSPRYFGYLVT